jgi:hypothetical protein
MLTRDNQHQVQNPHKHFAIHFLGPVLSRHGRPPVLTIVALSFYLSRSGSIRNVIHPPAARVNYQNKF